MTCPRCQHENRPQAKFCEECAAPLVPIFTQRQEFCDVLRRFVQTVQAGA